MNKPKILVYVREYLKFNYLPLFAAIPDVTVSYLTDFPSSGMKNIRDSFYAHFSDKEPVEAFSFDLDDVILRCRLLRNIEPGTARKMVAAMYGVMKDVVGHGQYDLVVGQIVDDYITHLLAIVAAERGIKYVGLCGSYFPGHTQVSEFTNGLPVKARDVTREEAQVVFDMIAQRDFRMDYAQPKTYSFVQHVKRVPRFYFKELAFPLLKLYRRDRLNYHYSVQKFLAQPKLFSNYPGPVLFHQDWEARVKGTDRRLVYFPLAVFPEASTDYWVPNTRFLEYEEAIFSIVSDLAKDNLVIVKEHAHMLGIRPKNFYARLGSLSNVVLVPPEIISNALLEQWRPTVVVGAGSVGVEATLRGLPVVTFSPTSYWYKPSGATYTLANTNQEICAAVAQAQAPTIEPLDFIRECLQTMIPFDFMVSNTLDRSVLASIRPYLIA